MTIDEIDTLMPRDRDLFLKKKRLEIASRRSRPRLHPCYLLHTVIRETFLIVDNAAAACIWCTCFSIVIIAANRAQRSSVSACLGRLANDLAKCFSFNRLLTFKSLQLQKKKKIQINMKCMYTHMPCLVHIYCVQF
jgi:hypothetical protein